jgi:uncharacterized protein
LFAEFGTTWLPFVMWRMDQEYRANREDVPWLTRPPSEYIRESVRLTTQPLEEPADPTDLHKVLGAIDAADLLLYSSDYPHHDFDNPRIVLRKFPEEWRERIFYANAHAFYGLSHLDEAEQHVPLAT